ncbi:MAG: DUF3592 domain-containing protein [Planctomycetota bacterium]
MTSSANTPQDFSRLARPPRVVPLALRAHLLTGPVMLFGSAFFAFGSIFAIVFVPATDPFGTAALSRKSAAASGWLTKVEKTRFSEGGDEDSDGTPIYRYEYAFRLSDGTEHRGTSYAVGQGLTMRTSPEVGPDNTPVQVEYSPGNPRLSRIKGMRTAPLSSALLFVVLFPLMGLLMAIGSAWRALRIIRLFRNGELAQATVTGARGNEGPEMPLEELKRSRQASLEMVSRHLNSAPAKGFMTLWGCVVMAIMGFGVAVCLPGLWMVLFGNRPMYFNGQPIGGALAVVCILGFLALWLAMGTFMLSAGRRMKSLKQAVGASLPEATCRFEFPVGARTIRATGLVRLTQRLGEQPTEPVLYDPLVPERAFLLHGLSLPVTLSPGGEWEFVAHGATARLLFVALCFVGPVAGFLIWRAL